MRTLKVLYGLVLDELVNQKIRDHDNGICKVIMVLHFRELITEDEAYKLDRHLEKQKPTTRNKYKEFTKGEYWVGRAYWWYLMGNKEETRGIRAEFLKEVIKHL